MFGHAKLILALGGVGLGLFFLMTGGAIDRPPGVLAPLDTGHPGHDAVKKRLDRVAEAENWTQFLAVTRADPD